MSDAATSDGSADPIAAAPRVREASVPICKACGYSLEGLAGPAVLCPECGPVIDAESAERVRRRRRIRRAIQSPFLFHALTAMISMLAVWISLEAAGGMFLLGSVASLAGTICVVYSGLPSRNEPDGTDPLRWRLLGAFALGTLWYVVSLMIVGGAILACLMAIAWN